MAYNISTNSQWPVALEKCEDYKLGNEIYKDIDVEKLYSKVGTNSFFMTNYYTK